MGFPSPRPQPWPAAMGALRITRIQVSLFRGRGVGGGGAWDRSAAHPRHLETEAEGLSEACLLPVDSAARPVPVGRSQSGFFPCWIRRGWGQ